MQYIIHATNENGHTTAARVEVPRGFDHYDRIQADFGKRYGTADGVNDVADMTLIVNERDGVVWESEIASACGATLLVFHFDSVDQATFDGVLSKIQREGDFISVRVVKVGRVVAYSVFPASRRERIDALSARCWNRVRTAKDRLTLLFIGGRHASDQELIEADALRHQIAINENRARRLSVGRE